MIKDAIKKVTQRKDLSYEDTHNVMRQIMSGETTDAQNAAFLTALMMKGESVNELIATAEVMRELSTKVLVSNPYELVDPVGTGGTHSHVFNVSTASCIVASCAGVRIAKHGSRSASSNSGSADILEKMGVRLQISPDGLSKCIDEFGIGFIFAPAMHKAMKNVANARREIGIQSLFNLVGPLTNPSGAKRQVLGVFAKKWLEPMAEVCNYLGQKRVMVVHSDDGLDEVSIAKPTNICELNDKIIQSYKIDPKDFGINYDSIDPVRVFSVDESKELINEAFSGKHGPAYDMIALNSAMVIYVAGNSENIHEAFNQAKVILDTKQAEKKLKQYAKFTQELN